MPNATWGDPEPRADEAYSPALLRQFLQQMMGQFTASGVCIALFDESTGQMVIRMHVRARGTNSAPQPPYYYSTQPCADHYGGTTTPFAAAGKARYRAGIQ